MNPEKKIIDPLRYFDAGLSTRICVRSSIFNIDFHLLISLGFLSPKKGRKNKSIRGQKNPSVTRLSTFLQREAFEKKKLGILRRPKYSWNKALDHYAIRAHILVVASAWHT